MTSIRGGANASRSTVVPACSRPIRVGWRLNRDDEGGHGSRAGGAANAVRARVLSQRAQSARRSRRGHRLDEAVAASRRAVERDPLSPFLQWRLGYRYDLTRQWDRAVEQYHNALELDPHDAFAHGWLALVFLQTGECDGAIAAMETFAQLMQRTSVALGLLGVVYAMAGRIGEARRVLEELEELAHRGPVPSMGYAWVYFGPGDIDRCFDWLEKAVDDREPWIQFLTVVPAYDPLRSQPRYLALLQKMNLAP